MEVEAGLLDLSLSLSLDLFLAGTQFVYTDLFTVSRSFWWNYIVGLYRCPFHRNISA